MTSSKMSLSQTIMEEAIREYEKKNGPIKMASIARHCDTHISTIFHNVRNGRTWKVENWLMVLGYLGALKHKGGTIVIQSKVLESMNIKLS